MPIATEVLKRGPANFNMVGQFLGYPLRDTPERITQGLANRLVKYAEKALADEGFLAAVAGWQVEVYTLDGDDNPADRSYCVRWTNPTGASLEVVGILTKSGWPTLDHGLAIHRA